MRWSELSRADTALAQSEVDDAWSAGDAVLYRLCSKQSDHREVLQVVAKLWLIGRAYSAAIERHPSAHDSAPIAIKDYYLRAAALLKRSDLDDHLSGLSQDPKTLEDLIPALEAHACLVLSLRSLSGIDQYSFASKYLHFHRPKWFFILDSIALRGLGSLSVRARVRLPNYVGHAEYRKFVARAWHIREGLASDGHPRLSPRELDRLLLKYGKYPGCLLRRPKR
jgi:hypothetical protein